MAENNYTLKLTLAEAIETRLALRARHTGLVRKAQEAIGEGKPVPDAVSLSIADTERILGRL
jgi:hypothetical protein